jgi:glycerophosphoryl diester phosphodiesterase
VVRGPHGGGVTLLRRPATSPAVTPLVSAPTPITPGASTLHPSALRPSTLPLGTRRVATPSVAGHRGASGHRPEHTLEAYRHALALGADAIEVDVVSTADGVLVARHESELSATTDVARRPELAHRRTVRVVHGRRVEGWFVEDLLLEEVRLLRARERWPLQRPVSGAYDGLLGVPTLDEVLGLVVEQSRSLGREVGVLVELKDATWSAQRGLAPTGPLLDDLRRHGLDHPGSPVAVMGFEPTVLAELAGRTRVPLVQLVDDLHGSPADLAAAGDPRTFADLVSPTGLAAVARYATGLGVRHSVLARDLGDRVAVTGLVDAAHRHGLDVRAWTLRVEDRFLPRPYRGHDRSGHGDLRGYAALLLDHGVDTVITDHPEACLAARDDRPADLPTPA